MITCVLVALNPACPGHRVELQRLQPKDKYYRADFAAEPTTPPPLEPMESYEPRPPRETSNRSRLCETLDEVQ